MIKISHTIFALPFALVAVLLIYNTQRDAAHVSLTWGQVIWIVLAFTGMRSFSMAVNRIVDAKFDEKNPRTEMREIPAKKLSIETVQIFTALSLLLTCVSAWSLAPIALYLVLPAAVLLAGYSYSKRFTFLCHYWLGAVIGMAPLGVYIALAQSLSATAWILFLVLFSYISGFDILYSIQDHEFDRSQQLHSLPADVGVHASLWISLVTHGITIAGLFLLHSNAQLGNLFFVGIFILSAIILAEHFIVGWGKNVKTEKIPIAFFHYNSIFSLLFLGMVFFDVMYF